MVVEHILIVGVVLVQACPEQRKDVPDLASQSQPKEERLDGDIGANEDGTEGGEENEYSKNSIVQHVCALGDAAKPGMPQEC